MARTKNKRSPGKSSGIPPVVFLIAGIGMIAVALFGIFFLLTSNSSGGAKSNRGPRLQVNTERIDLGKQPLDKTVRAEFVIANVGEQTLTLDEAAPVQALEGC